MMQNTSWRHDFSNMLSSFGHLILTIVTMGLVSLPLTLNGQQDEPNVEPIEFRTGTDLERFNTSGISVTYTDIPFGEAIQRFSQQQRVGIFVDRRVDKSQRMSISVKQKSLEQAIWAIADRQGIGVTRVGDIYYLGPQKSASILVEVFAKQQLSRKTAPKTKTNWNLRQPTATSPVINPKLLLSKLAMENQFRLTNLNQVEHDLWGPLNLPPTSLELRLALLLIGFGKTLEHDANDGSVAIIDIPDVQKTKRTFKAEGDPKSFIKDLRAQFKDLSIVATGKTLSASGPPDSVALLAAELVKRQSVRTSLTAKKTYTINTVAQRGAILASIASQTSRSFKYDKPAPSSLREEIKVSVNEASLEELINEVTEGTDLLVELTDSEIVVSTKK